MLNRCFVVLGLAVVLAASAGCGSNDGGACFSPRGNNSLLCVNCVDKFCGTELTTCYGSAWPTDDLNGGTCAVYGKCIQTCGCGNPNCPDKVCNQSCLFACASPTSDCNDCLTMVDMCRSTQCGTSCN